MGGWTLDDLWNLDTEDYAVLVEWINKSATSNDPDDIDMDAFIAARKSADAHAD